MPRSIAAAPVEPRWQRLPDDRPRLLMASALKLLKRHGYGRVRLEDIAKDAGVCKGTVYHYFTDKDDLLTQAVASRMNSAGSISSAGSPMPAARPPIACA